MKCGESEETILDYVDGVLNAPDRRAVEQHIDMCPTCAEKLAHYRAMDSMLSSRLTPPQLDPSFARRLQQRTREAAGMLQMRWLVWLDIFAWGSVGVAIALALRLILQVFGFTFTQAGMNAAMLTCSAALVAWAVLSAAFDFRLSEH